MGKAPSVISGSWVKVKENCFWDCWGHGTFTWYILVKGFETYWGTGNQFKMGIIKEVCINFWWPCSETKRGISEGGWLEIHIFRSLTCLWEGLQTGGNRGLAYSAWITAWKGLFCPMELLERGMKIISKTNDKREKGVYALCIDQEKGPERRCWDIFLDGR